jgi:hypothetical protein
MVGCGCRMAVVWGRRARAAPVWLHQPAGDCVLVHRPWRLSGVCASAPARRRPAGPRRSCRWFGRRPTARRSFERSIKQRHARGSGRRARLGTRLRSRRGRHSRRAIFVTHFGSTPSTPMVWKSATLRTCGLISHGSMLAFQSLSAASLLGYWKIRTRLATLSASMAVALL